MEKQYVIFIGIVALIVAITLGFFYVNGTLFPASLETGGKTDVSNLTFKAEAVPDGNYLIFRYTPVGEYDRARYCHLPGTKRWQSTSSTIKKSLNR